MSDRIHRSRTISLRLSEVEYEAIVSNCHACGAVNISDLVRLAVSRVTSGSLNADDIGAKLCEIDLRLGLMDRELMGLGRVLREMVSRGDLVGAIAPSAQGDDLRVREEEAS